MSAPVTSNRLQLRSACDACSVAKVKCDKKRPACDRCCVNSFTCSYSPSRRHGKQSWAKRVAERQYLSSEMPRLPPTVTPTLLPLSRPYGATDGSGYGMTLLGSTPGASKSGSHDYIMGADGDGGDAQDYSTLAGFDALGEDSFDFLAPWTSTDSGIDLTRGSDTSETPANGTCSPSAPNGVPNSETSTPTTSPEGNMEAAQSTTHDCEAKAFTTLHSLHYCTMLHTERPGASKPSYLTTFSQQSSRMPPLDKVLYCNRRAMCKLKELLDCPCAQQPHLALIYMAIVSKALLWYQLAVSPQHQPQSSTVAGLHQSSPPSQQEQRPCGSRMSGSADATADRGVGSTVIKIGVFDLEDEDQKVLMRSVLLREVRKVETLIEKMKQLGCGGGGDGDLMRHDYADDEQQEVPNWYAVAGAKMEVELHDTLRRIKEFGAGRGGGVAGRGRGRGLSGGGDRAGVGE